MTLVVRAETDEVGEGYVNHQNPQGFATFADRQGKVKPEAAPVICPRCYIEVPPSGLCDNCG